MLRLASVSLVILNLLGCEPAPSTADGGRDAGGVELLDPAALGLAADPRGEWLAGDLHVHATGASNDTGGDSLPADIARVARERGLFFVVLTDHSNSTGSDVTTSEEDPALFNMGPEFPYWDRAAELSVAGELLLVDGNELSPIAAGDPPTEPTGHVGCVPADLEAFDREGFIRDRPRGTVSGADTLQQARDRGCFSVLNHPWGTPWISFDWSSFDYDAIEVWNGTLGLDRLDGFGQRAWRCDLLQGRAVTAVGGSDNHRVNREPPGDPTHPALGYPTTWVFAAERTWPAIVAGLRAGLTSVGDGASRLAIDGYDEGGALTRGAGLRYVRLRGHLDESSPASRVRLVHTTACEDTRAADREVPTLTEGAETLTTIEPGADFDLVVSVDGGPGVYTATMTSQDHWGALSGALVVP